MFCGHKVYFILNEENQTNTQVLNSVPDCKAPETLGSFMNHTLGERAFMCKSYIEQ